MPAAVRYIKYYIKWLKTSTQIKNLNLCRASLLAQVKSALISSVNRCCILLTCLCHLVFFAAKLKIAKVIPIFKVDNPCSVENYRTISILPAFSNIFEKIVHNQISKYLTDNMILCNNQYGFREKHSTSHALVSFIKKVASAIDDKKFFASVFLDLSKAFDTIDHSILLRKFELYGLSGTVLNRVKCYLSNRTQVIQINWITSCEREIVESPRDPF